MILILILEEHNLPFVNDFNFWNYSHLDKFIFRATNYPNQKAKIPYFTSYKFNKNHIGSNFVGVKSLLNQTKNTKKI